MNSLATLEWIKYFIAVAVLLQTLELLALREYFAQNGVWTWRHLKKDYSAFPKFARSGIEFLLKDSHFMVLLTLRLVTAVALFWFSHPLLFGFLAFTTLLTSIRWRGTFNGGSDSMTLLILASLTLAYSNLDNERWRLVCLGYIGVQSCLSYFVAGCVKAKRGSWWRGEALSRYLEFSNYLIPQWVRKLARDMALMRFASVGIIVFELSSPLALLNPGYARVFIALAFVFHLANFCVFGLNRFLFAWLASYPALYYCSFL